ncbi:tRNA (cytidine(34)-2'-O)-methyltransferase [Thauera linaloolentis]|uniref:tRNA (cytidine(34)-2'-O)-methyltransferase n=1 Tax=Thauera linaloolentis (strain DSM 12138 / JCM 21573 / CCUG 41526 / CIP 105981 / IAM 15112 / NBRC 102519 / 47Lol) TaxID=1123367 RepID=N6Z7Y9_THAL4|nr:tRNA (cytidine(34)-2'-O)-methyltransferase [Thauera linaloolentis]ENO90418.1 tRNA/rRNA methyltransferase SpoU [Thauera linaloolentis 47Lol = DSM 12138]MCM8564008.1 tRNA (cytidine(34)-2'-O)-methyltransferase [Thauera linaloolentis]
MFEIVLYQPEIPPNTGNIIRLAANTGSRLHLIEPLGFDLSDKHLARAGLDYHDLTCVTVHQDWARCCAALEGRRFFALSTRGSRRHDSLAYREGDVFVFGPESRGLPAELLACFEPEARIRIPMRPTNRSVNLSNAVAVVVYEAWRQQGFAGAG